LSNATMATTERVYEPLTTVATGAVITITVQPTQAVYSTSATVPFTLTNDLSALSYSGQRAKWSVLIDYQLTNALSTVWDSRISWTQQTPDLTVTGRYEFAFETLDGVSIIGRQTYPTVYRWESAQMAAGAFSFVASAGAIIGNHPLSLTTAATNSIGYIPLINAFQFVRVNARANLAWTNEVVMHAGNHILLGGAGGALTYSYYTNVVNISSFANIGTFRTHVLDGTKRGDGKSTLHSATYAEIRFTILGGRTDTVYLTGIHLRMMNELEIAAYNAGWRP
jgi:hypothetical protein